MGTTAAKEDAQPPPARAPRVGLLPSVTPVTQTDGRWAGGIIYTPEAPHGTPRQVIDPCGVAPGDMDPEPEAAAVEWDTYVLHDGVVCSTFGHGAREWEAVARRRLASVESFQLERELWTGTRAQASGWPNPRLASPAADSLHEAGATDAAHGLELLEEYLAKTLHGQRGAIHATPQVATRWYGLDLIRREGPLLLTVMDTIVVPGHGYPGTGPDGTVGDGNVWAYATDEIDVRLGGVNTTRLGPGTLDRSINDVSVRAERFGLASWPGEVLGAVRLDVEVADIGGGS